MATSPFRKLRGISDKRLATVLQQQNTVDKVLIMQLQRLQRRHRWTTIWLTVMTIVVAYLVGLYIL